MKIRFPPRVFRLFFFSLSHSVNITNLRGVGKSLWSNIDCETKNQFVERTRLFGVHQNRIEFIVVNWISFLLFLLLTKAHEMYARVYFLCLFVRWWLVITVNPVRYTLFIAWQVSQLFQSSFEILRIMFQFGIKKIVYMRFTCYINVPGSWYVENG